MGSTNLAARRAITPAAVAWVLLVPLFIAAPARAQMGISLKPVQQQEIERRTATALAARISLDFTDAPLADVAELLSEKLGVNCELDLRALEEPALDGSTRVTFKVQGIAGDVALTRLLATIDESLTWITRDSVLLITTKTKADAQENFEICVYPVRDLVETRVGRRIEVDYDSLVDVIQSTIAPDTWGDAPGQGSIKEFDKARVLVISHTASVHVEIARLLQTLRAVQAFQSSDGVALRRFEQDLTGERPASQASPKFDDVPQPAWRVPRTYR